MRAEIGFVFVMSIATCLIGCDSREKKEWYEDDAEVEKFANRIEDNIRRDFGSDAADGFRKGFESGLRGEKLDLR